ncbi:amino acid ABC transporter permease [Lysinibacillus sphaericus]|uniref:Cysteine ABC transporter permease n=1 Tax=Lysinibacillus sphaericus TaxID=1421 RepID=A0A2S0JXS5_LYSSH|nr:amino acid ABC transporter permease [Lysinibacillus sphaericus]AVK95940.1 cysteine ABC transporter permease [Lysinibacillus sphaericus]MED4545017.1 amino acid ABC transporter permease [Lysinibacillus sphaericus]TKI21672.1 amino acid ABC transporter permease [Lysinibacillus sphaericus]SUV18315.1 sulfur-containing amino acid ABC transporter permease TcyL [Lysinibacillus sphaericus]GEC80501.1 L-cystine transport system permease protein TcyL [Lysinibacillus sphaericus]
MGNDFDWMLIANVLPILLQYLPVTLEILFFSIVFGILFGFVAAIPKLLQIPILKQMVTIYISFIRGTPILIQLFLVFYGVPALLKMIHIDVTRMDAIYFVIITYTFSNAASFAEIFRAAILTIDRGQLEAAYVVGLNRAQAFLRIILPQALRIAFPNIANTMVSSLKDTSLAFSIGVMDMVGRGETLIASTTRALEIYLALSVVYYVIVVFAEKVLKRNERYLNRYMKEVAMS